MDITMAGSLFGICILLGFGCPFALSACKSGHLRLVDGTGCKSYQECVHGQWLPSHNCPYGLLFNLHTQTCDWSYTIDLQTCPTNSSPNPATSTSPASTNQVTDTSQGAGPFTQCGQTRCYHGYCRYDRDCYNCPPYNYHCSCISGYTGESCTQKVDPVSSGPVSTSPTTTAHHSPHLGLWFTCGALHCYHSSACSWTCYGAYCLHPVDHHCNCYAGYTGDTCTLKKVSDGYCYSRGLHCHSGHCVEDLTTSNYVCHCLSGYTGDGCELRKATTVPTVNIAITTTSPTNPPSTSHSQTTSTTTASTTTATTASTQPPPTTAAATTKTSTLPTTTTTRSFTTTSTSASTSSASTPDTPTSTRNSSTQTSTAPIQPHHCNPTTTISAIINVAKASNNDIPSCPSGSSSTPEAFVWAHCQIPLSSMWTQGLKVQQNCSIIPLYTPVATFNHERYSSTGGLSGIFLGCIQDGFKLGVQQCDNPPTIIHVVSGGLFTMDPDVYFTVQ